MTAWQDQPPQSRRQLRLNERGLVGQEDASGARTTDALGDSVEPAEPPVPYQNVPDQNVSDQNASNENLSGQATTSAEAEAETRRPRSRAEALAGGRRSQRGVPRADADGTESSGAEPLNYFTQGRSQVPVYGGPSFGVNAVTPPPADPDQTAVPEATSGAFRVRDFRPEARRSAFSSTAEQSNVPTGGGLDYYTQQGRGAAAEAEHAPTSQRLTHESHAWQSPARETAPERSPAEQHSASEPSASERSAEAESVGHDAAVAHSDHTMTRRELRAMRESAAARAVAPTAQTLPAAPTAPTAQTSPTVPLWRANESPAAPVDSWSIGQAESPTGSPTEAPTEAQADPAEEQTANRFPFGQSASKSETAAELRDPIPLRSPKAPAPRSSRELSDAMAEFDALMASGSDSAADPAADSVARDLAGAQDELEQGDGVDVFDSLLDVEPSIETPPETSTAPSSDSAPVWPLATDPFNADPFNTDSFNTDPFGAARRVHETSSAEPTPTAEAAEPEPVAEAPRAAHDVDHHYVAPVGHWSRQAADDGAQDAIDDEPNHEGLDAAEPDAAVALGRTVGTTGGAVTANHLVMSSVPTANDLLKPFSPTGEIMITGTIDLPRSLGTTGAHPARYDHSDVDTLLEASDREDSNVDSAPVRAIRAVSTHTSSRGLIGTGKPPRSSRLPMILAVSTAAVAAVVVVLFVAGIVLRVF